jgi:serine/threonine protein kinase
VWISTLRADDLRERPTLLAGRYASQGVDTALLPVYFVQWPWMSDEAARKFGPYQVIAPIGEGGMGQVFKARDTRLDRIVALKVSHAQFSDRFAREARATAALNHPHIATFV